MGTSHNSHRRPGDSLDGSGNPVAVLRIGRMRNGKLKPIARVASKTATDLNDILNAVSLRVALLRSKSDSPLSDVEIDRLARLVEQAALRVRGLQACAQAVEPVSRPDQRTRKMLHGSVARVLLIDQQHDDDADIKDSLKRIGCRLTVAGSAEEALEILQSDRRFDNVICNAVVLAANGWTFAADIARVAPGAKLYLVAHWRNDSVRESKRTMPTTAPSRERD